MKVCQNPPVLFLALAGLTCFALAGLEPGDELKITLRGINAAEHDRVNGDYQVGETGSVHLPLLGKPVNAKGLTPEQFARAAEAAYKAEGIYTTPTIEAKAVKGVEGAAGPTLVSVGGQVKRGDRIPYQKGMTVIHLAFKNLRHKSIGLRPNDSLQVSQKGTLGSLADNWKGNEEAVKDLME